MKYYNTQGGLSLIGIILAIMIIAALIYGSSLFFQKKENPVIIKQNAEKQIDQIQKNIEKQNNIIQEELDK